MTAATIDKAQASKWPANTKGSRNDPRKDGMPHIIPKGIEKTEIVKYHRDKNAPRRHWFAQRGEGCFPFPSSGLL